MGQRTTQGVERRQHRGGGAPQGRRGVDPPVRGPCPSVEAVGRLSAFVGTALEARPIAPTARASGSIRSTGAPSGTRSFTRCATPSTTGWNPRRNGSRRARPRRAPSCFERTSAAIASSSRLPMTAGASNGVRCPSTAGDIHVRLDATFDGLSLQSDVARHPAEEPTVGAARSCGGVASTRKQTSASPPTRGALGPARVAGLF
jgi:hypothetical protein